MTTIRLHNTLSRTKEDFVPLDPQNVRMYVCGPTVYDRAHLGNARPVVVFDVLFRLLRHVYGEGAVKYARNFTDVDDKINAKAAATGRPIRDITDETIGWYHADMDALGNLRPTFEPRATDHIGGMIAMIQTLIDKGHAYAVPISFGHNSRAVYFNSATAPSHSFFGVDSMGKAYGSLSGRTLEEMLSGAKAEKGEGKKRPMDFVLWKPSTVDEPGWESPWGFGRPGWHIECSAMSKALLGSTFDIHGGGIDLQFPHHENEIAQSCCANGTRFMAKYWMHNEMLLVEGKKMSKSLGNFFTVRDLLDQGVPGEVIRYVMLMTHYRSPMDWTEKKAREASVSLERMHRLALAMIPGGSPREGKVDDVFVSALSNDLNTSEFLKHLHGFALLADDEENPERLDAAQGILDAFGFLGLFNPEFAKRNTPEFDTERLRMLGEMLAVLRSDAIAAKNFAPVDALKSALIAAGVEVRMSKSGVELVPGPGFDPAKLEGL